MTAKLFWKNNWLLPAMTKTNQRARAKICQIAALVLQQPVLISSILVAGLVLGVRQVEVLQPLELMEFDRMTQLKPEDPPDPRILVVEVTEADIQAQKQWPLSDRTVARLLSKLQSYQPKVIGLDIHRDLPRPPGHAELVKQLQAPNAIAIYQLGDTDSTGVPPPPGVPKEQTGFNDFVLDPDGVIRRNFMYTSTQTEKLYSFSLRVSLSYLKDAKIALKANRNALRLGKTAFIALDVNSGGYQNIDAQGYQILVNYRRRKVAPQVTLTQVLNGEIDRNLVKDKVVLIATGKIAGFEALMRWQSPEGKFISPAEFIPVAEETGSIVPLGKWILQESCRQLHIWQKQFPIHPPLMMSVNLSGQQFSQPDLVEQIEKILKETGVDGHSVKLEITESMAMNDVESTIAIILRLKALNLRFSIDDFGTGYSSLSYLHRFPVDTLKVDRSFVSRMDNTSEDAAIVQTIVMLSHNLSMDVVAEGVETAPQMERLRALQCEYGQGYFFSKPMNSEAATAFLAAQPQW